MKSSETMSDSTPKAASGNSKVLIIVLILFVLCICCVALGVVATAVINNQAQNIIDDIEKDLNDSGNTDSSDSSSDSDSDSTPTTPMPGFLVYTNSVYGIEIQYPSTWELAENVSGTVVSFKFP